MSLFLTPDELYDLTDYKMPAHQREWLQARGWKFEVGKSGRPKVSRNYFEDKMAGRKAKGIPSLPTPNFDAIS